MIKWIKWASQARSLNTDDVGTRVKDYYGVVWVITRVDRACSKTTLKNSLTRETFYVNLYGDPWQEFSSSPHSIEYIETKEGPASNYLKWVDLGTRHALCADDVGKMVKNRGGNIGQISGTTRDDYVIDYGSSQIIVSRHGFPVDTGLDVKFSEPPSQIMQIEEDAPPLDFLGEGITVDTEPHRFTPTITQCYDALKKMANDIEDQAPLNFKLLWPNDGLSVMVCDKGISFRNSGDFLGKQDITEIRDYFTKIIEEYF